VEKCISEIAPIVKDYYDRLSSKRPDLTSSVQLSAPAFDEREAMRAISTILSGMISQGANVKEFEENAAQYFGTRSGIATNSGSSSNLIALLALKEHFDIQDGSEVILPATTFATVSMPVIQAGLTPVYADVDIESLNISPDEVQRAISKKTSILMPVHTLGYPADMSQLMEIASKHDLAVIEDCCESHGSTLNGQKTGSFGNIATFSFFVAHNMTTGEGGMIVTNDDDLDLLCRSYREFGRHKNTDVEASRYYSDEVLKEYDVRYVFDRLGYNMRMTDVAAAFGIEQLKKLDKMNDTRRENASKLIEVLESKSNGFLSSTVEADGYYHTYYTFPILLDESAPFSRREFAEFLEKHNIETRPLFAGCLPDQPAFRDSPGRNVGNLENARYLRDNMVFVGIHPGVGPQNIEYMGDIISQFISLYR